MTAVKFTFEDDFTTDGPQNKRLKSGEIDQMRQEAYNEGKRDAGEGIEKQCEFLLDSLVRSLETLTANHEEQVALMHKETAKLAHAITAKLAPALVSNTPLAEIELLVDQCLKNSPLEPRLVIRVDENMLPHLEMKIEQMKEKAGYSGQVVLIAEEVSHIGDCRVEWADGGAERDFDGLMKTIDRTIQLFLEAPLPTRSKEAVAPVETADSYPAPSPEVTSAETPGSVTLSEEDGLTDFTK